MYNFRQRETLIKVWDPQTEGLFCSALEIFLNMCYINLLFTYLLSYFLWFHNVMCSCSCCCWSQQGFKIANCYVYIVCVWFSKQTRQGSSCFLRLRLMTYAYWGMIDGSNKRGRPYREWSDDIEQWCGATLQELSHAALDRQRWAAIVTMASDTNGCWAHGCRWWWWWYWRLDFFVSVK